ncbi:MAG: EFR1 family ferrodoxin [Clostridiales bacterium]|nr:EFR1 family ferrodoxin [Clostridiales bacterium]
MVFYFSGTGNSKFVAEKVASVIGQKTIDITSYTKNNETPVFTDNEVYVFVCPSYMSSPARLMTEFIESATFPEGATAYLVVTCASSMGISPRVGADICKEKGMKFMGAAQVVMPQDYIILFSTKDREGSRKIVSDAIPVIEKIAATIKDGGTLDIDTIGAVEYAITKGVREVYYKYFMKTKRFRTTDACVSCGMCAKVCPLTNIVMKDGKPSWGTSCTHCMACINRCPKDAIEYGRGSVGKPRYKGPEA